MVMHPPGHRCPRRALLLAIGEPWHYHRRHGANPAVLAALVPNMTTFVRLVGGAIAVLLVAEAIDLRGPVAGSDAEPSEGVLQRFQKLLAKLRSSLHGNIRIIRKIRQPVDVGDLAVEKIAHKKGLRQADPAEVLRAFHRFWRPHGESLRTSTDRATRASREVPGFPPRVRRPCGAAHCRP